MDLEIRLRDGLGHSLGFVLSRPTKGDLAQYERLLALDGDIAAWIVSYIKAEPTGFDDFPADGAVVERCRAYFLDPTFPEARSILVDLARVFTCQMIAAEFRTPFRMVCQHFAFYLESIKKLTEPPDNGVPYRCGPEGSYCGRPEKNWRRRLDAPLGGCRECVLTEAWTVQFTEGVNEAVAALGGWPADWPLRRCLQLLFVARRIVAENDGGIPDDTDLLLAEAAVIWQLEKAENEKRRD